MSRFWRLTTSRDAIAVEPSIRFDKSLNSNVEAGETLILDSGEDDLNRSISRKTVPSADVQEFEVAGYSKPYFFKDEASMLEAIEELVKQSKEGELQGFLPTQTSVDKTEYCLTFGDISIIYAGQAEGEDKKRIASPVYRIYPNKKGDYLEFSEIQSYIKNSWQLAFYDAIAPSEKSKATTSKSSKSDSKNPIDTNTLVKGLFLFLIIVGSMMAGSVVAKSKVKGEPTINSITSPALTGLANMSASAKGDDNLTLQQQLQIDQTKKLLKEMNIDLDANAQDMGCFTN